LYWHINASRPKFNIATHNRIRKTQEIYRRVRGLATHWLFRRARCRYLIYEPGRRTVSRGFDRNRPPAGIAAYFAGSVVDHSTDLASFS
jgi:hypothetical protein